MSWAIRWARGSRPFSRSSIPTACARIVLGGLGMHLVDGVGLPESIAEALEAPSLDDVTDPQGRMFRAFADQTKSDRRALAACIRGSRQVLTPRAGGVDPDADADRGRHQGRGRGLGRGTGRADAATPRRCRSRTATTCSRSATRCSRRACCIPRGAAHDAPDRARRRDVQGRVRQHAGRRRLWRGGAAGAAAARRRPDPSRLEEDRRSDRAAWAASPTRSISAATAIPNGSQDGAYQYADFAADARVLADTLAERSGVRPAVVGASLGGMAALLANSQPARGAKQGATFLGAGAGRHHAAGRCSKASSKIQGFMRAQLREGFGSIAEAADAVAAYLPHRPRPRSHEGLKKNLRLHPDGRWRWHWDPRFLEGNRRIGAGSARGRARRSSRRPRASPSRRCWCAARPRNWCRRSTPRISSSSCRTRPMSTSAAPATWSPATATTSSQTPLRAFCRTSRAADNLLYLLDIIHFSLRLGETAALTCARTTVPEFGERRSMAQQQPRSSGGPPEGRSGVGQDPRRGRGRGPRASPRSAPSSIPRSCITTRWKQRWCIGSASGSTMPTSRPS